MEYSNYVKGKVREQGGVQFNLDQFNAVFNLVHLEGTLKAWENANAGLAKTENSRKYDLEIADAKRSIRNITGGLSPQEFMRSLFKDD